MELVNLHLVATGVPETPRFPDSLLFPEILKTKTGERQAYFGDEMGWAAAKLINRSMLDETMTKGPFILQEFDATILVPPDFGVTRDAFDNIIMRLGR